MSLSTKNRKPLKKNSIKYWEAWEELNTVEMAFQTRVYANLVLIKSIASLAQKALLIKDPEERAMIRETLESRVTSDELSRYDTYLKIITKQSKNKNKVLKCVSRVYPRTKEINNDVGIRKSRKVCI